MYSEAAQERGVASVGGAGVRTVGVSCVQVVVVRLDGVRSPVSWADDAISG